MTPALLSIPVEQIAVIDRGRKNFGNIPALAEDIKANGQITPGVVRKAVEADRAAFGVDPNSTPYVLVAGERRYRGCVLAGCDYQAVDRGTLDPLTQKILELSENLHRKDLEPFEEVAMKAEIFEIRKAQAAAEGKTYTQRDLAAELRETPANTSRDLKLAEAIKADPTLKQAGSKASAVRILDFNEKIKERTAKISKTPLGTVQSCLHTADMRDFIRTLPTHSVDLCFTDFPFGIDYNFDPNDRNKYADSQRQLHDLLTDMIPEIVRVTKPSGWLALMMGSTNYEFLKNLVEATCAEHFDYFNGWYEEGEDGEWEYYQSPVCNSGVKGTPCRTLTVEDPEWIWHRPNSQNPSMHPSLHAQNQYEKICVVNMGTAVLVKKNGPNVLVYDAIYGNERIHEMQRPPALCEEIIQRFTLGGELVLDLCFGSGQHLASAARLQRRFLGCDLNPKNLEPAVMLVAENFEHPVTL